MPLFNFDELINQAEQAPETSGPRKNFEPLESGDYEFVVKEAPKVNTEKQYLNVRGTVVSGDRQNYNVFFYISFKQGIAPFAAKQTVSFLSACGIPQDQLRQAQSLEDIANALVGRPFTAYAEKKPDDYKNGRKDANDTTTYYKNELTQFRPSTGTVGGGGGNGLPSTVPQANNVGQPQGAPQFNQQAPPQPQFNNQAPPAPQFNQQSQQPQAQGQGQPNPVWDSTPQQGQQQPNPAQGNGPTTNFTPPPMPFGN